LSTSVWSRRICSIHFPNVQSQKIFGQNFLQLYLPKKQRDGRNKTSWHVVAYVCDQCHCTNNIFDLDQGIFLDDSSMVAHRFCKSNEAYLIPLF